MTKQQRQVGLGPGWERLAIVVSLKKKKKDILASCVCFIEKFQAAQKYSELYKGSLSPNTVIIKICHICFLFVPSFSLLKLH